MLKELDQRKYIASSLVVFIGSLMMYINWNEDKSPRILVFLAHLY